MFLMRISFIKDLTSQTIDFNIFTKDGLPLTIPVGGNDTNVTQLATKLTAGFTSAKIVTDASQATV
jgi:hypothetical protein